MVRCKKSHHDYVPTHHKNDPDDKIGEVKVINHGCGTAGTVSASLKSYMPQNGEYVWAGEGDSCHYSSKNTGREMNCTWGCIGGSGKCAISGKRGLYKRQYYNAKVNDCCMGKANKDHTIDGKTCHPDARSPTGSLCVEKTKSRCKSTKTKDGKVSMDILTQSYCRDLCSHPDYKDFCASQKKISCDRAHVLASSQRCMNWCKENPTECQTGIADYCGIRENIFDKDICTTWCNANEKDCLSKKSAYCNNADKIETNEICLSYCKNNMVQCKSGIEDYCKKDNNIFTKNICSAFCNMETNKSWCQETKGLYCNQDAGKVNEEGCKDFCMTQDGFGHCDSAFEAHCEVDKTKQEELQDPRCTCLNSKVAKYNPLCVDTKCTDTGYATSSMLESKGSSCNITDCSQYVGLKDILSEGTFTANQDFLQQCGTTINQYVPVDEEGGEEDEIPVDPNEEDVEPEDETNDEMATDDSPTPVPPTTQDSPTPDTPPVPDETVKDPADAPDKEIVDEEDEEKEETPEQKSNYDAWKTAGYIIGGICLFFLIIAFVYLGIRNKGE